MSYFTTGMKKVSSGRNTPVKVQHASSFTFRKKYDKKETWDGE
jgi:hypothetical protein